MVRVAVTSFSYVSGAGVTPAAANALAAADPHGTSTAHSAIFRSGLAKSASPVMPAGLPAGTTISSELCAKTTGVFVTSAAASIVEVFADANTSPGAPASSCCDNADDAPKLNVTVRPGFSAIIMSPSLVNVSCSDAAANTTRSPDSPAPPDDAAGGGPGVASDAGAPVEHPATRQPTASARTGATRARDLMDDLPVPRRRPPSP